MQNDRVSEILRNHRSYRYAARVGEEFLDASPTVYNERRKSLNRFDATRYNRIVTIVDDAINNLLTDEERTIIKRKYTDQNPITLGQIATILGYERKTAERRHKTALKKLAVALSPVDGQEEITPFEHMFNDGPQITQ